MHRITLFLVVVYMHRLLLTWLELVPCGARYYGIHSYYVMQLSFVAVECCDFAMA